MVGYMVFMFEFCPVTNNFIGRTSCATIPLFFYIHPKKEKEKRKGSMVMQDYSDGTY